MRIIHLPTFWTVLLDVFLWLLIHIVVSWSVLKLRVSFPRNKKPSPKEEKIYEKLFFIRDWKDNLPDAARFFSGGFKKAHLEDRRNPSYLKRFIEETYKGEIAHWISYAFAPLFFLWNKPWVGVVMLLYGCVLNIPCILIQRYNRSRLLKLYHSISKV